MVVWEGYVSDEMMGIIVFIIVYWVYVGVNQFFSFFLDKFWFYSIDEENEKNVILIIIVVKGVLF